MVQGVVFIQLKVGRGRRVLTGTRLIVRRRV